MKIGKNSVVTLDYSVTDTAGNLIDGGAHPIVYLHGGYEGIFPKIEEALSGKSVGDSLDITLAPEDAFGEYDETLRNWGVYVDQAFFLGGVEKAKVLSAFRPHIFFDDQDIHLDTASKAVPSGKVPYPTKL